MAKKPHILITNDDGINAEGIWHLWHAIKNHADLTIIAPDSERSASSLSITTQTPLKIKRVEWPEETAAWSVNGTPADCVKLGLSVILDSLPDLIVSGINRGSNAGRNVLYSGTVAGVIEGIIKGVPGIAFSCQDFHHPDFSYAETYIPHVVEYALANPLPPGTLLNVNFPENLSKGVKGFKLTRQGKELWTENPNERKHPAEGHSYYWLGVKLASFEEKDDCDVSWIRQGYMTAVPIHIEELTDHAHLAAHKAQFENLFSNCLDTNA